MTYGAWIGVPPADFQRAFRVWCQPEYLDLRLNGLLANAIQPRGVRSRPQFISEFAIQNKRRTA